MSFACDICPKTFSVKRSLIRHVDSRHKKIKVFCSLCNKPFSRTDSLAHHINTMHPSKPGKKAVESKRKQKKAVKVMREQVRVKRERKRLPPFDIKPAPIANESNPLPDHGDESTRISQETPTPPKAFPLPLVEFFSDNAPADVQIKSEVHMEVEPSIELNGEEDYPGSTKSQTPAYIFTHLAEKQKRFNAADELDYTVLDLMQQNALDAKDEDRMFLLSILSDFKRVPMEKKLKVKARIVGAIVDALD